MAARTLGEIKDRRAVEPLMALLKDEEEDVRDTAAYALGLLGDERGIEPLIGCLQDPHEAVRREAAGALKTITGQDFGQDYDRWKQWWEGQKER
jgi:HEAT repeat protein